MDPFSYSVSFQAVQAQINLLKLRHRVDKENRRRAQLNKHLEQLKGEEGTTASIAKLESGEDLAEWEIRIIKVCRLAVIRCKIQCRAFQRCMEMDTKIRLLRNRWNLKNTTLRDVLLSQWTLEKQQSNWSEGAQIQVELPSPLNSFTLMM